MIVIQCLGLRERKRARNKNSDTKKWSNAIVLLKVFVCQSGNGQCSRCWCKAIERFDTYFFDLFAHEMANKTHMDTICALTLFMPFEFKREDKLANLESCCTTTHIDFISHSVSLTSSMRMKNEWKTWNLEWSEKRGILPKNPISLFRFLLENWSHYILAIRIGVMKPTSDQHKIPFTMCAFQL